MSTPAAAPLTLEEWLGTRPDVWTVRWFAKVAIGLPPGPEGPDRRAPPWLGYASDRAINLEVLNVSTPPRVSTDDSLERR